MALGVGFSVTPGVIKAAYYARAWGAFGMGLYGERDPFLDGLFLVAWF